jgi:hypothetical protein
MAPAEAGGPIRTLRPDVRDWRYPIMRNRRDRDLRDGRHMSDVLRTLASRVLGPLNRAESGPKGSLGNDRSQGESGRHSRPIPTKVPVPALKHSRLESALICRLRDFKLQMVPLRHTTKEAFCSRQQLLIVLCDMRRPQDVPDRPGAIDLFEQLSFNRF